MEHYPLGTILLDPATTASDNGKNTHWDQLGVWDKPVKDLAARDALKVASDRALNPWGNGSGLRTLNMTVTLNDGTKYQLRIPNFATLTSDTDKVNALANNANWVLVTSDGGGGAAAVAIIRDGVDAAGDTLKKIYARLVAAEAIIGEEAGDNGTLVTTVRELLAIFNQYPEGVDMVQALAGKVNTTAIVNTLTETTTGKVLDARQGKVLKDLLDALSADVAALQANGPSERVVVTGITENYGGFVAGTDFDGSANEAFNKLLKKDYPPTASISAENGLRQIGSSTLANLNYNVGVRTNPITSVVVAGQAQLNANGTPKLSGTVQVNTAINTNTDFSVTATDSANKTATASTSVRYSPRRFWGGFATDPATMSDSEISAALRALTGQELSASRTQPRSISLNNQYPVFGWVDDAGEGSFLVNGLPNNAFKTRLFQFSNSDGYVEQFRLSWGSKDTGTFSITVG